MPSPHMMWSSYKSNVILEMYCWNQSATKRFTNSSASRLMFPKQNWKNSVVFKHKSTIGITQKEISQQKSSLIGHIEPAINIKSTETEMRPVKAGEAIGVSTSTKFTDFPEAPPAELCCGSGCPNCVWIQYADEVLQYVKSLPLHDGIIEKQRKMVRDALKKNVTDDNLRVFLLMEIEAKGF